MHNNTRKNNFIFTIRLEDYGTVRNQAPHLPAFANAHGHRPHESEGAYPNEYTAGTRAAARHEIPSVVAG
jgi:hypothetical protein